MQVLETARSDKVRFLRCIESVDMLEPRACIKWRSNKIVLSLLVRHIYLLLRSPILFVFLSSALDIYLSTSFSASTSFSPRSLVLLLLLSILQSLWLLLLHLLRVQLPGTSTATTNTTTTTLSFLSSSLCLCLPSALLVFSTPDRLRLCQNPPNAVANRTIRETSAIFIGLLNALAQSRY